MLKASVFREILINTTRRYYFTPTRMAIIKKLKISVGEDVKKLEPLCVAGGNVKWYSHYRKQSGCSSKN